MNFRCAPTPPIHFADGHPVIFSQWSLLMVLSGRWRNLFSSNSRSRRTGPRAGKRGTPPQVEALEERTVPALRALSAAASDLIADTAAGNSNPASVSDDGRY